MTKRFFLSVLVLLALTIAAGTTFGQTGDGTARLVAELYEGVITDVVSHTMDFPDGGDYVLYIQTDFPVDMEILLPGRRSFRHRATELSGNLVPLDVGREGTATLTFTVANASLETAYARSEARIMYFVVPAQRARAGRDVAIDLSDARVDADGYFYAKAFLFHAPDSTVTYDFVAEDPEHALTILVGNEVSVTGVPNFRGEAADVVGTEYTSLGGRQALLVLYDSFNSRIVPDPFTIEVAEVQRDTGPPTVLSVGAPEVGVIDESSRVITGRPTERFVFRANRYQELGVVVRSEDFDTFVTVQTPSEIVLTDDDGADGTDSLLMLMADEEGVYSIYVSSYGGDGIGDFNIMLLPAQEAFMLSDSGPDGALLPTPPPDGDRELPDLPVSEASPVIGSTTVGGRVTESSSVNSNGDLFSIYDYDHRSDGSLHISVESSDFDTYLIVTGPGGIRIADDDGGESTNSKLTIENAPRGRYLVYVGSYVGDAEGEFTLTVGAE